ncbi:RNI-like protein [Coniochaeta ligniaria NRRL 30616]|uniref:RNI-like protein n=1 Tax=Coniochaeta ligniaria NRRL 30616 TaxID=1408157 RepID=A0A1J7J7X7_9PEZI|nr:RNI-like protein [Coniochaeta ligniaria NRRL 30616]
MASSHEIGERLSYDGALCTVRYIGPVAGTSGSWLGVEWDDPTRGKHDGQHKGVRYFECKIKSPTSASFIRPTRPHDGKTDFLTALHEKYATEHEAQKPIVFSTKVAEEVGFAKISRQQAQLHELKIVILDSLRLVYAYDPASKRDKSIRDVCPSIVELGMSRNLLTKFGPVVEICSELDEVKALRLNGNRFADVSSEDLTHASTSLRGIKELALEENLLTWSEIVVLASHFPDLTTLLAASNQIPFLTPIPSSSSLNSTLTSLNLEFNDLTTLSSLSPLTSLTALRNLHLKNNRISTISHPASTSPPPIFPPSLHYLDLSSNLISTWSFVDLLPVCFPGLSSLRFAHNPIYANPDLDSPVPSSSSSPLSLPKSGGGGTEESYMLLTSRLPSLRTINFSTITPQDRTNADMFYLSRIARQLAAVPESDEHLVLARHPRYAALCEAYGAPVVSRTKEVDARFLEGRVVRVCFRFVSSAQGDEPAREKTVRLPKSFDLYAVKGIAGRLFGLEPLELKLVWETGEWDPVGGFDEEVDSSEDEDEEKEEEGREEGDAGGGFVKGEGDGEGGKAGRWVEREVELGDGPRQFGYCVDGMEARIRVEVAG